MVSLSPSQRGKYYPRPPCWIAAVAPRGTVAGGLFVAEVVVRLILASMLQSPDGRVQLSLVATAARVTVVGHSCSRHLAHGSANGGATAASNGIRSHLGRITRVQTGPRLALAQGEMPLDHLPRVRRKWNSSSTSCRWQKEPKRVRRSKQACKRPNAIKLFLQRRSVPVSSGRCATKKSRRSKRGRWKHVVEKAYSMQRLTWTRPQSWSSNGSENCRCCEASWLMCTKILTTPSNAKAKTMDSMSSSEATLIVCKGQSPRERRHCKRRDEEVEMDLEFDGDDFSDKDLEC